MILERENNENGLFDLFIYFMNIKNNEEDGENHVKWYGDGGWAAYGFVCLVFCVVCVNV